MRPHVAAADACTEPPAEFERGAERARAFGAVGDGYEDEFHAAVSVGFVPAYGPGTMIEKSPKSNSRLPSVRTPLTLPLAMAANASRIATR